MGQELGLDGQPGVVPLSDCFAEMSGIPANDDGGEQVEPGHAVVLALAPTDSSGNAAACMPPASIPSAISPSSSPSQDQPSIAHSTGAFPLSVRSCPLPESTRESPLGAVDAAGVVGEDGRASATPWSAARSAGKDVGSRGTMCALAE